MVLEMALSMPTDDGTEQLANAVADLSLKNLAFGRKLELLGLCQVSGNEI